MKRFLKLTLLSLFLVAAQHSPSNKIKPYKIRPPKGSSFSKKKPKHIPIRKPKTYKIQNVIYFNWPDGLEFFGAECPNKGFIEAVYGKAPNLLYEVRVPCKGNIEQYEYYFLVPHFKVLKIVKRG